MGVYWVVISWSWIKFSCIQLIRWWFNNAKKIANYFHYFVNSENFEMIWTLALVCDQLECQHMMNITNLPSDWHQVSFQKNSALLSFILPVIFHLFINCVKWKFNFSNSALSHLNFRMIYFQTALARISHFLIQVSQAFEI